MKKLFVCENVMESGPDERRHIERWRPNPELSAEFFSRTCMQLRSKRLDERCEDDKGALFTETHHVR